jgi:hypothetical protein
MNGMKFVRDWEPINSSLQRLRIPNGWLVRSSTTLIVGDREVYASEALCRVEDPDFNWQLEK